MQIDKIETFTVPDKSRKIGNPEGKYILYIEDYAHTFIRQNLQIYKQKMTFFTYGHAFLVDGTYYILVRGAVDKKDEERTCFEEESYLGVMTISTKKKENVDSRWTIQCEFLKEIQCSLQDFFIYYEKNEAMQNYLISWHEQLEHKEASADNEIKMKYTRAIQEQNHNNKEMSTQKKLYSGICFAFCIVFMVMMVTVINSYQKMNSLQADIVDLMKHIENTNKNQIVETMENISPNIEAEVIKADDVEEKEKETEENTETEEETESEEALKGASGVMEDTSLQNVSESDNAPVASEEVISDEAVNNYQSYIVQRGDTLQGILYRKYGSLSNIENICTLNALSNPDDIKEGEELYLP